MSKDVEVIKPFCNCYLLDDLESIISISDHIEEKYALRLDISSIRDKYDSIVLDYESYKKGILEIFRKRYYGKFIRMLVINPETSCKVNEFIMVPYRYVKENDSLFGLICYMDNDFRGGINDDSINLFRYLEKYEIQITEITEEEFLFECKKNMFSCFSNRMNRILGEDYVLTDYGYEFRGKLEFDDDILPF